MNNLRSLLIYTACSMLMFVSKEFIAFLPNVELVSFLCILYALHFELKGSLFIVIIFCFLQILFYGIGFWTPMYFIVWPLLVVITYYGKVFFNTDKRCAILSGVFGLTFGFILSIPFFILSITSGWASFIRGIPFDLIHCLSNYIIMLLLFNKVDDTLSKLTIKYELG